MQFSRSTKNPPIALRFTTAYHHLLVEGTTRAQVSCWINSRTLHGTAWLIYRCGLGKCISSVTCTNSWNIYYNIGWIVNWSWIWKWMKMISMHRGGNTLSVEGTSVPYNQSPGANGKMQYCKPIHWVVLNITMKCIYLPSSSPSISKMQCVTFRKLLAILLPPAPRTEPVLKSRLIFAGRS